MKTPFQWDHYSDQPYQLKDRDFKKSMRRKNWFSLTKTFLISLIILPVAALTKRLFPKRGIKTEHFFAMGVNLDKLPEETPALVEELGVQNLIIRLPLWEMERINEYVAFVKRFTGKTIMLSIMQDREHIEDLELLEKDFTTIFESFSPYVHSFQIGTTINRAKWGFFSVDEYLRFFGVAYWLKQQHFPNIHLIGSSVIDFEYHFTVHTLFNFSRLRYDAVSALLYVDRRGNPENTQMGFGLSEKISLLSALINLSPKTDNAIYITETNWPLSNTAPYAPTSEFECVDEESYADYMVRYYLLALASQQVDAVYWHQLIAPGYGLVDHREGIKKRSAFYAYKTMLEHLSASEFLGLDISDYRYTFRCKKGDDLLHVIWSLQDKTWHNENHARVISRDGKSLTTESIVLGSSPIYLYPEQINAF